MSEPAHPLDGSDNTGSAPSSSTGTSGVGVARHLSSLLIALPLVPIAYLLLDYSAFRATSRFQILDETLPTEVYVTMGAAAGLLFVVAAAGRLSGLGPLVAAVLWGALPTAWVYGDFSSYADAIADVPEVYDEVGFGLLTNGFAVYPATAGLLLGAALAGRWRRRNDPF